MGYILPHKVYDICIEKSSLVFGLDGITNNLNLGLV